jgi:hypothetical protein
MPEQVDGTFDVVQTGTLDPGPANVRITFSGDTADITAGGNGENGDLVLKGTAGSEKIKLDGGAGDILVKDDAGNVLFQFDSGAAALYVGGTGQEGDVIVRDATAKEKIKLDGGEGDIIVRDSGGNVLLRFDSGAAALYVGGTGNEGDVIVRDAAAKERIKLDAGEGDIIVRDSAGNTLFRFDSEFAALYVGGIGNEGDVIVRDADGNQRIKLDGGEGDIKLFGADCAEEFDVVEGEKVDPGMVLVMDEYGKLRPCEKPYDKKVVGVVCGANGFHPGIILGNHPARRGRLPIGLSGRVYCMADARSQPIEMGDLLTTSSTPGHAMKATDPQRAFGSVIGKALHGLREGTGLVDLLITLQ